jgi:dTDP-4-amino-4,6-dideoxygalactose transaminase
VATTNSILWEGCTPVFADIDPRTFCIDVSEVEKKITPNTQAILTTHVYGMPCNVEAIEALAAKYNLKVIYDGAHAFGCSYHGKSLLSYGDISTCSFHATKIFHTVEGGAIICKNEEVYKKLLLYRSFGQTGEQYLSEGINAKNSELHAAMGLAILPSMNEIIERRKALISLYRTSLQSAAITMLHFNYLEYFKWNYSYFPILFESEAALTAANDEMSVAGINCRRYFFPSLNKLPFLKHTSLCPISEDISKRVLCLPLYYELSFDEVSFICSIINNAN